MIKINRIKNFFVMFLLNIGLVMALFQPENATGWYELYNNANIINAVFTMYDTAFVGWIVAILFFVYQFMLILKTRNLTLSWITGVIFVSLYMTSEFVKVLSAQIIFVILVLELAGILYLLVWK